MTIWVNRIIFDAERARHSTSTTGPETLARPIRYREAPTVAQAAAIIDKQARHG
jgi:hypothetical protein